MTSPAARQHAALAIACAFAFGALPALAQEQQHAGALPLAEDSGGRTAASGAALCWHRAHGPAPAWTAGCPKSGSMIASGYAERSETGAKREAPPPAVSAKRRVQ